ncbi:hypothetical protein AX16_008084 [Volvariella volvacea WC 439]|nr:hypothetical protein AX16_008084 [Volvariella volvacea WC 439]
MGSAPATSPMEQARILMAQRDIIEAELNTQFAILTANSADMQTPLVDAEGFPRADLDIYAIRKARVRIIELRNDLNATMEAIGKALQGVYDPNLDTPAPGSSGTTISPTTQAETPAAPSDEAVPLKPFARVNGVAPGSPAAEAVRKSL